ncbi:KptA family-domain-containing protein [Cyathus striatus]|nr:KptA family-domain-containing protein [Cyathus striatus]
MQSSDPVTADAPAQSGDNSKGKKKSGGARGAKQGGAANQKGAGKLRGLPKDSPEVRLSKTISWLLRHGAKTEGLAMRTDGFVKISDFLESPKIKATGLTLEQLQEIVKADTKQRYDLRFENDPKSEDPKAGVWWIKANQGHSIKAVKLDLKPIHAVSDISTGIAVHGTTRDAWKIIEQHGLSKMTRNHIHLAQGIAGTTLLVVCGNNHKYLFSSTSRRL